MQLDFNAGINAKVSDLFDELSGADEGDDSLVNPHFVPIESGSAISTRTLPCSNVQVLGGEPYGPVSCEVLLFCGSNQS